MADVEKALSQTESLNERSPISEGSSHHADKEGDGKTNAETMKDNGKAHVEGSNSESRLVDWEPNDPEFPQNFTRRRKFIITLTAAGLTLTVTFSASVFSAAIPQTSERFNVSTEVMILGTSLFVLGFGLGPTIFGPLSELYGRKIPLFIGFIGFAIFQIPVAVAQNLQTVLVGRFFQGMFGSSPTAVVGGILADIWDQRERGFAMPSFAGTLFAGPACGPIAGAYISGSSLGWRWTQWITLIMCGFFGILAFINVPETFAPVLLVRRAKRLRSQTGNEAFRAKHEENKVNFKDIFNRYLLRPSKMFCLEPILTLITIYLSFVFGLLFLFFEAYPISFVGLRGWAPGVASLPFIGILVGVFIGCALMAFTTKTRLAPSPQEGRPIETRLLLMALGSVALPVGLFWFAWTSYPSISPWPQIIAGVPIGFSVIVITLQGLNYTIDCYTFYANSAIAAITFVRSLFGAGFPLFATTMYSRLGVQWATSVLAFISVALIPVPVLFYIYGAKIRGWSKYVPT